MQVFFKEGKVNSMTKFDNDKTISMTKAKSKRDNFSLLQNTNIITWEGLLIDSS